MLPLGNPAAGDKAAQYDDFNFGSAAWTLSAHEGRPGHELQFTAMVERGVSLARTMFAFNSVNVEGWALYAEAEMVPYEPLDGQLIALQFRLLRAARAMLDPMLNLGLIDRANAERVLIDDVGLSKAMATQELDRYMVRMPGQAGSYFYGYTPHPGTAHADRTGAGQAVRPPGLQQLPARPGPAAAGPAGRRR